MALVVDKIEFKNQIRNADPSASLGGFSFCVLWFCSFFLKYKSKKNFK
jgi:hypothetical protein